MTSLLDGGTAAWRAVPDDAPARRRVVTAAAMVLVAVHLAFRAWAVTGGWFFGDDFQFLADPARGDADIAWIFHRHNLHLMPFGFVLVLLVDLAGPFAWWAAAAELLVFQLAAGLSCWWMLRTAFGDRLRILVPLTVYLFSAVTIPSLMWWAAGLNSVTVQPAIFLAIGLHLQYVRTGRRRYALGAATMLTFGLLCYVKALFIAPMLLILTLSYVVDGSIATRMRTALIRFRLAWFAYALPCAVYVIVYFTSAPAEESSGKVDYADLGQRLVAVNLSTALFGGPWHWEQVGLGSGPRTLADPPLGIAVLCLMLLVAGTAALMVRYRGVLTPLWFLVPYIAATVALLAYGRAGSYGRITSMELRYWADFLPYAVLAMGLVTMPMRGLRPVLRPRPVTVIDRRTSTRLLTAYVMVFVVGSIVSSVQYVRPWHDDFEARRFIETARDSVAFAGPPVALADVPVPDGVVPAIIFPYNLPSRALSPVGPVIATPDIGTDMSVLDEWGRVTPAFASPDFDVSSDRLATCLGGSGPTRIELGGSTFDFPFWLSMSYRATGGGPLVVQAGATRRETVLEPGRHTLSLRTEGSYDSVDFTLPPSTQLCVDTLHIGARMEPR